MPDIAMCQGTGCAAKKSCYRYIAKPSERQSYFMNVPGNSATCGYYIEARAKSQVRRLEAQTEKR